jgi:hypothetical protein
MVQTTALQIKRGLAGETENNLLQTYQEGECRIRGTSPQYTHPVEVENAGFVVYRSVLLAFGFSENRTTPIVGNQYVTLFLWNPFICWWHVRKCFDAEPHDW